MCAFPLLGDWIGKGVKKGISAGTEAALKAGKTGKDVIKRLEITYKALSEKAADLRKYLDDAVELVFKIVDDTGDGISHTRKLGDASKYLDEIVEGSSKTGTVWDNITPTQDNWPNTQIPRSFEVEVNGQKMWVHGNATEHMYDDVCAKIMASEGAAYTNPNLYT